MDSSKEHIEKIVIEIDSWQNQRYKPMLGGWGTPFQSVGGIPYFSDITGNVAIPHTDHTKINKPNTQLPNGWQWSEEWKVDMSGSYGGIDEEGWSYGTSFESLIASTMQRTSSGIKKSLSLVRRRRWIRTRFCASTTISLLYKTHKSRIESFCEAMYRISIQSKSDKIEIEEFENDRLNTHSQIVNEIEGDIKSTMAMLNGVSEKLRSMKLLLLERGNIELQYSKKLQSFSEKWIDAGDRPKEDSTPSTYPGAKGGFFYLVSTANASVAQRLEEFATILTTYLPADVDNVLSEVESIKNDCLLEDGPQLRAMLTLSNEMSTIDFKTYLATLEFYNDYIQINSDRFRSTLISACASHITSFESVALFKPNVISPSKDNNDKNETDLTIPNPPLELGLWFSLQLYYQSTLDWEANLLAYQAYINQQRRTALSVITKVSSLLQATIKVFAHEQSRVWLEATSILQTLSTSAIDKPQEKDILWKEISEEVVVDKKAEIESQLLASASVDSSFEENGVEESMSKTSFPLVKGLQSSYLAIHGKAKYCTTNRTSTSKSSFMSNKSSFSHEEFATSTWLDTYVVITYDMMIHLLPFDSELKGPMLSHINNNMNSVISIDIRKAIVKPILITTEGEGFYIIPSTKNSIFTAYQHHLSNSYRIPVINRLSSYGIGMNTNSSSNNLFSNSNFQRTIQTLAITQIGILLENSIESNKWMRIIRNVFTDLNLDQSITDDLNENENIVGDSGVVVL